MIPSSSIIGIDRGRFVSTVSAAEWRGLRIDMDYSLKSGPKGDEILSRRTESDRENRSEVHQVTNKVLSFGVDRILATDKNRERNVIPGDIQFLPKVQFLVPSQGEFSPQSGLLINKRLIRPQAIRIAESAGANGRGKITSTVT